VIFPFAFRQKSKQLQNKFRVEWDEVKLAKLKKHLPVYGAALVLFGLIVWLLAIFSDTWEQRESYEIVCFGDSIFGQDRGETSVCALLEEELNMTVYNGAFGGTGFCRLDRMRSLYRDRDGLSFAALSQAVAYEDFSFQRTIFIKDNGTEYFRENIETLDRIDFEDVDIFIVAYGINDYHSGTPLMNPEDPYDPYTFTGAIRQSIESLQTRYPLARIILVTPSYRWITEKNETGENYNTGYGTLPDYIRAQIDIAEELGVEILDHYDLYPHESYEDWRLYTIDGLHPNEAGRARIAHSIAEYLSQAPKQ
jgi:lysophospholipase L1-like esterase